MLYIKKKMKVREKKRKIVVHIKRSYYPKKQNYSMKLFITHRRPMVLLEKYIAAWYYEKIARLICLLSSSTGMRLMCIIYG